MLAVLSTRLAVSTVSLAKWRGVFYKTRPMSDLSPDLAPAETPSAQPVPPGDVRGLSLKATKTRTSFERAVRETGKIFQGVFGEATTAFRRTDGALYVAI